MNERKLKFDKISKALRKNLKKRKGNKIWE